MLRNLWRTGLFLACLVALPAYAQYAGQGENVTYLETRLSDLESQLRAMNGRLEKAEWQNKQLRTALERFQADAELRFGALEQGQNAARQTPPAIDALPPPGPPPPSPPPAGNHEPAVHEPPARPSRSWNTGNSNIEAARRPDSGNVIDHVASGGDPGGNAQDASVAATSGGAVEGQLGKLYLSDGAIKGADSSGSAPPLPKAPPDYGLTPQEQYDRAFGLLRTANYDEAETAFRNFIGKNPKDKMIDNAKYWLGETHYARAQYDAAAVAFADAYQTAPKGSKAAESLLKLGLALAGLDKRDDACTTLAELKNQFPHAPASLKKRTAQEIKKLKCGG